MTQQLEQATTMRLGGSYEALEKSEAFIDLMRWLEDSVEAVESQAANVPPEEAVYFREHFMLWQQRKKVVNGIKQRVELYIGQKKQLEEELTNERPDDLGSSSTDYALPGYNN